MLQQQQEQKQRERQQQHSFAALWKSRNPRDEISPVCLDYL
jgi:hypothetical protein